VSAPKPLQIACPTCKKCLYEVPTDRKFSLDTMHAEIATAVAETGALVLGHRAWCNESCWLNEVVSPKKTLIWARSEGGDA
jgi:hypothetical protein